MKTKEEFEALVADLTELEMTDLLEVCNAVIIRNKWGNLRDECIGDGDKIDELEDAAHELQEKIDSLEREVDDKDREISKVLSLLENDMVDEAKRKLALI